MGLTAEEAKRINVLAVEKLKEERDERERAKEVIAMHRTSLAAQMTEAKNSRRLSLAELGFDGDSNPPSPRHHGGTPFSGEPWEENGEAGSTKLSLIGFEHLLADSNLIDADFSRRDAALCFVWAQGIVTDEIARRRALLGLSFVDFFEALARVTTMKPLPTAHLVEASGARCASDFFAQLARGEHGGPGSLDKPSRRSEECSTAPLGEPLEILITMILDGQEEKMRRGSVSLGGRKNAIRSGRLK